MCKVSIIVPIHCVEAYLRKCIDSILNQTFTDFECILVDDGSPDNCGEICDEYARKDNRIKVIHKENGGVSSARNAGIDKAQGEYICFTDADDYIDARLFEIVIRLLNNDSYDMINFNFRKIADSEKTTYISKYPEREYITIQESEYLHFVCNDLGRNVGWSPCCRLFKANIIKKEKIYFCDRDRVFAEDLLFFLEYLVHVKEIKTINNVLYNYTEWDGSFSVNNDETRVNEFVNLCEVFYQYLRKKNKKVLIKKFYVLFYIIINIQIAQSSFNDVLADMRNIDNKKFLRRNIINGIIHSKEIAEYKIKVNRKALIYEYLQYYLHSGENIVFKVMRSILKKPRRSVSDKMEGEV